MTKKKSQKMAPIDLLRYIDLLSFYPADPDEVLLTAVTPFATPVVRPLYRIIDKGHFFHTADTRLRIQ